jgi:cysteine-rich repeat protein
MIRTTTLTSMLPLGLVLATGACAYYTVESNSETGTDTTTTGDGDGDGDGEPGDGDGDGDPGDGDGDPVCGDGVVEGTEECDDGNLVEDDECSNGCVLPVCGDDVIEGLELCDDANMVDDDACPNDCIPDCGDMLVQGPEECDDGNMVAEDECLNECVLAICGDGVVNTKEEDCDDANMVDDDECPNSCVPTCGDSLTQGSEDCDDANMVTLDGCNACVAEQLESLDNVMGVCTVQRGCTNPGGTNGNPQELVECFTAQDLTVPFEVVTFTYQIGNNSPAPAALEIVVYAWDGVGAPGTVLGSEDVAAPDLASGEHTVVLLTPVQIDDVDGTFCVGLRGTDPTDGFRAMGTDTLNEPTTSYFKAPGCDLPNFIILDTLDVNANNWCFQSTILQVE